VSVPDYGNLRNMVGHRVTFDFDTGARVVGYLAGCRPEKGAVQVALLEKADVCDSSGRILETHGKLSLVPNVLCGYRVTEGPGGF
jgi:hypothetical protein